MYACTYCTKSFRTKDELQLHITGHHTAECALCSEKFVGQRPRRTMDHHLQYKHFGQTHYCSKCFTEFLWPNYIVKHIRNNPECHGARAIKTPPEGIPKKRRISVDDDEDIPLTHRSRSSKRRKSEDEVRVREDPSVTRRSKKTSQTAKDVEDVRSSRGSKRHVLPEPDSDDDFDVKPATRSKKTTPSVKKFDDVRLSRSSKAKPHVYQEYNSDDDFQDRKLASHGVKRPVSKRKFESVVSDNESIPVSKAGARRSGATIWERSLLHI